MPLGHAAPTCSRTPVPVAGGPVRHPQRGLHFSCGRANDGTWYCWGSNNYGQLGSGTTGPEMCQNTNPCSSVPVAVSGGVSLAAVFPGYHNSCGVTIDGTAYCWGSSYLGDGSTSGSLIPIAVAGGLRFASIRPYSSHTCGLTPAGVAYCWGYGGHGELGDGSFSTSLVPVRVAGLAGAAATVSADAVRRNGGQLPAAWLPRP
jgi:alpha-tubulin suppressor-like RCC1 family protein